jgi:hypothetical protein
MGVSDVVRRRLEAQGFCNLDGISPALALAAAWHSEAPRLWDRNVMARQHNTLLRALADLQQRISHQDTFIAGLMPWECPPICLAS